MEIYAGDELGYGFAETSDCKRNGNASFKRWPAAFPIRHFEIGDWDFFWFILQKHVHARNIPNGSRPCQTALPSSVGIAYILHICYMAA
jgi:hypothetical protein